MFLLWCTSALQIDNPCIRSRGSKSLRVHSSGPASVRGEKLLNPQSLGVHVLQGRFPDLTPLVILDPYVKHALFWNPSWKVMTKKTGSSWISSLKHIMVNTLSSSFLMVNHWRSIRLSVLVNHQADHLSNLSTRVWLGSISSDTVPPIALRLL